MDLRLLTSFVTLVEEMHYTKAADKLGLTQSALTQQVQTLERDLGSKLIDRTNRRRIQITAAGRVLFEEGHRLLMREKEILTAVQMAGQGQESLHIAHMGSATSHILPAITRRFHESHPDTKLHFYDISPEEQDRRMARQQIDLSFTREPFTRRDFEIDSIHVYHDELLLVVPSDHPEYPCNSLVDVRERPMALYDRQQGPWLVQAIEGLFYRNQIAPRVTFVASGMIPLLLTVASGQAYSVLPSCVCNLGIPGLAPYPRRNGKRRRVLGLAQRHPLVDH
jgi:DNA-binding transcriptional LysR family regulator